MPIVSHSIADAAYSILGPLIEHTLAVYAVKSDTRSIDEHATASYTTDYSTEHYTKPTTPVTVAANVPTTATTQRSITGTPASPQCTKTNLEPTTATPEIPEPLANG